MISRIPLRWRLALWSSFASVAAIAVFAIITSIHLYSALVNEEDEEVGIAAGNLLRQYEESLAAAAPFRPSPMDSWINYALFDSHGSMAYKTPGFDEVLARKAIGAEEIRSFEHKGRLWRTLMQRSPHGSIATCYDLQVIRDEIKRLAYSFIVAVPLVAIVVSSGAILLSRRTLAPLNALTQLAQDMHAGGLHQRVPLPAADDELRRLACVLNELFARLEKSFEQANRFSADASHELRTPLTILRGQLEALIRKVDDPQVMESSLLILQEEVARLERTTEHLLQLSRFDSGKMPAMSDDVDLTRIARESCDDAELLAAASKIRLKADIEEGIVIRGNPELLRQLFLNLLANAVSYNMEDGSVSCSLVREATAAVLRVSNTGPGIDPVHHERLFTRFYRCDPSRSDRKGQGLGLSLSREIARAHGGDLVLSPSSKAGWTEFIATLPSHDTVHS